VEVDISSIELEKPSQIVAHELVETGELENKKKKKKKKVKDVKEKEQAQTDVVKEESVVGFEKTEEEIKSAETQEVEEEKRKKKIPVLWLLLGGGLVLLLFVIGGGYLVYRNYFLKQQSKKEIAKPETLKKAEPKAEIAKPEPSASISKEEIAASSKQEGEPKDDVSKMESKVSATMESKVGTKESNEIRERARPKFESPAKPTAPKVPSPKYVAKHESKPFLLPKEVKIVETTSEEYSIEIFSTADPEEANYWVTQFQKRGINVYQKVHKVKNVPYYKIRIGSYKSIEEARNFARNLGFRNFWIDRIK
ncbi:MAG: SPOR domain-containing protein, partial [Candidatus Kapaibacteriota bacterium]